MCISEGRQSGSVLFNIPLNTFHLRLYSVRHIVNDHSISERGNPLLPLHWLLFRIAAIVLLYAPSYRHDSIYHSLCYTSRGMRNRTVSTMMDRSSDPSYHKATPCSTYSGFQNVNHVPWVNIAPKLVFKESSVL